MKSNLKKVYTCCNNCESTNSTLVTTGTDYECGVTDDLFSIVRCSNCGLLYMNPRPDLSELPVIYPKHYAPYNVEDNYDDQQRRSLYYKMRYKGVLSFIEQSMLNLFPDKRDIVMLDIGCADGHTLSCFKRIRYFNIDTYGVDISAEAVEKTRAKGHKVYLGRFEDVDLPHSFFDFVYASHVIEHVPDPKAFTRKVHDLLKPGGIFGFWTPNTASLDAKWFRHKYWGPYCFPRHWFMYDAETVKQLAKATNFEFLNVCYAPIGPTWILTLHNIFKDNKYLTKYADLLFPPEGMVKLTVVNFLRNGFFAAVDLLLLLATGQTANMGVAFRKPDTGMSQDALP